jgi:CO/xanthine dehydrogenase Mo-binding subunit
MGQRKVMGTRINRLDGIAKSTGAAKYNSDLKPDGMLYGALLTSPHAHAKVTSIDTSAAEKLAGLTAVRVSTKPGTEIQ